MLLWSIVVLVHQSGECEGGLVEGTTKTARGKPTGRTEGATRPKDSIATWTGSHVRQHVFSVCAGHFPEDAAAGKRDTAKGQQRCVPGQHLWWATQGAPASRGATKRGGTPASRGAATTRGTAMAKRGGATPTRGATPKRRGATTTRGTAAKRGRATTTRGTTTKRGGVG